MSLVSLYHSRICSYLIDCIALGIAEHAYLEANDHTDSLTFAPQVHPKEAGMKTEERLEELLKPGVKSLTLTLYLATGKKGNGAKQKLKIIEILEEYVHRSSGINNTVLTSLPIDMVFSITLKKKPNLRAICMSKYRKSSSGSGSSIIGQSRRPRRRKTIPGNIH